MALSNASPPLEVHPLLVERVLGEAQVRQPHLHLARRGHICIIMGQLIIYMSDSSDATYVCMCMDAPGVETRRVEGLT